jgi:hypothetical protein
MSVGSPKLEKREQAIEAARRRLRRLEIEAHRIKADLARLEAEYEDDVADFLTRKLRRRAPAPELKLSKGSQEAAIDLAPNATNGATVIRFDSAMVADFPPAVADLSDAGRRKQPRDKAPATRAIESPLAERAASASIVINDNVERKPAGAPYRKAASPLLLSGAVHMIVLFTCVTITIATVARQDVELYASPPDLNEDVSELAEVKIEATKFDDSELQNVSVEREEFNLTDNLAARLEPAQIGAGTQNFGDIGQLDALPGDLGTLMAGAGKPGSGTPGGPLGEAVFFGARSKGDRFVFVVDNSSSMKGGRLEAARAELLQAVSALSPRQSFYVIFVSDRTYPMFFPSMEPDMVAATNANIQRLANWVPNALLASGKSRELIKAMDMAATLRPHAVYLLWDGDMKYSDKVRLDVMTHLTRPDNQWDFVIHTLGMGVLSLDSQQNLAAIAAAHGGVFQRVDVPAARGR